MAILYPERLINKVRSDENLSLVPSGGGILLDGLQWPTLERERKSIPAGRNGRKGGIDVAGQKASETFQITNQAYNDLLITIGKQEAQLQFLTTKLKAEMTQIQEKERQMKIDMQKMKKKTKTQYTQTSIALTHHPECAICMEKFSLKNKPYVLRECGHSFCQYCIHNLHKSRLQSCPMCRTKTLFIAGWVHTNYVAIQYENIYGQRISGFVKKQGGETKAQRRKSGRLRRQEREELNVVGIPRETLPDVVARAVSPLPVAPPLERHLAAVPPPLDRVRAVSLERPERTAAPPMERQRAVSFSGGEVSPPTSPRGDGNIFSESAEPVVPEAPMLVLGVPVEVPRTAWAPATQEASNSSQVGETVDFDDLSVFVPAPEAGGMGSWHQLTPTEHFALRAQIQQVRREREWTDADNAAFISQIIHSRVIDTRNSLDIPSTSSQVPRDSSPPHFLRIEDPDPD